MSRYEIPMNGCDLYLFTNAHGAQLVEMFLKPFRVKSNTACKSSERRRLKERICSSYPFLSQASLDELLPSKCSLASSRVFTHSNCNVNIFIVNGEPLFFEHEANLCPTVYTLWRIPDLVPSASTSPYVITKLHGGADLMLPGIILPKEERGEHHQLRGVQKGQMCSVTVVENRASLGVGVALMSYDAMVANQWRGKGFKMLHLNGDRLWELGSKSDPPLLKLQPIAKEDEPVEETAEESSHVLISSPGEDGLEVRKGDSASCRTLQDEASALDIDSLHIDECEDQGEPTPLNLQDFTTAGERVDDVEVDKSDQVSQDSYDTVPGDATLQSEESSTPGPQIDDPESSTLAPQMDDLISECFCMAIKTSLTKDDLPMLTSTFYRSHMMPLCPLGFNLDIKKSKHKKLSKFLSAMQDDGVLKINEASKGVETITEVDFKHPKLKEVVPKYVFSNAKTKGECSSASAADTTSSRPPQMTVTELYMPTRKVLPVFTHYSYSTASMMTLTRVREVVTRYIKEGELVSPSNSSVVVLDPVLTDAVSRKGEPSPTQLSWHQVITRVLEEMRPGYSIQRDNEPPVYKRTKLEPVRLTVVTRTGNKKATLVDNLDYFDISAVDIVHQVQRVAAASATVNELSGRSTRKVVMVQGNNVKVIAKLLQEEHGLPLKYIEAVDKTKVPKTQKRHGSKR